ncbi:MAG: Fic family protein [Burkholderiales bacterium]|nr:Fic family protein [Burkholderiales bacterium]
MFRHLTVEAVRAIHAEVLRAHGGSAGLRDAALLESAVAAPQASFGGEPLIDEPVAIAAAYLFYLCRNHPFVDGNKRTALAACLVVLEANGLLPDVDLPVRSVDAWEALVLDVAASRIDREQTTARLKKLLRRPRARRAKARR